MRPWLALPFIALAAQASADTQASVARAFGNTIVSTYPDGRKTETWLTADGAYTSMGRRRDTSDGHWTIKGDKVCFKQSHPFPAPFSVCVKVPTSGMESGFTNKAVTGEMTKVTLVKGPRPRPNTPRGRHGSSMTARYEPAVVRLTVVNRAPMREEGFVRQRVSAKPLPLLHPRAPEAIEHETGKVEQGFAGRGQGVEERSVGGGGVLEHRLELGAHLIRRGADTGAHRRHDPLHPRPARRHLRYRGPPPRPAERRASRRGRRRPPAPRDRRGGSGAQSAASAPQRTPGVTVTNPSASGEVAPKSPSMPMTVAEWI